jgi:hypothetical protein
MSTPKHTPKYPLFFCLLTCFACLTYSSEFRTFTDVKGRHIEAKITRTSGKDIYIERRDGFDAKVDISTFSEADQEYIKEWAYNSLLKSDLFDVRFSSKRSDRDKYTSCGIEYEKYTMHYDVVITNNDYDNDFKNIKIEYLIVKFEDALAAKKKSHGTLIRFQGSASHHLIQAREEIRISTEKFPMQETDLAPGYFWTNGGKENSKDVIRGIWVKIYVGDKLVHEISKPENMMRKESWN